MTKKILIETCCGFAEDVMRSEAGGAHRSELCSNLFQGGLTPTVGMLKTAKRHSSIPINCMIRPREGGFHYTDYEFETALDDAHALLEAGADGLVFGFLHEDGTIDMERSAKILEIIGDKDCTFHRAIDVVPDWREAIDQLADLGVRRILTSGQEPDVFHGMDTVREMVEYTKDRLIVMPGAGITPKNADRIREATGVKEMHVAFYEPQYDRSSMNNRSIYFGGMLFPSEERYQLIDTEAVKSIT